MSEETKSLPENHFTYGGKQYKVVVHAAMIRINGSFQTRTALEICADEDAQKELVEGEKGENIIEEVID